MGIFWRVGSRTHSCVRHRCVGCRAGTNTFGHLAGLGAGPVRVFFFLGNPLIRLAGLYWLFRLLSIVLAWMCVIKQVGGVAGGRDSTIFLASPAFWWVRYD